MFYDQNREFGSGDGTKSLKSSRRLTCFAANNEGFGRNRLRNRVVKIN